MCTVQEADVRDYCKFENLAARIGILREERAILFRYPTPGPQFAFGRRKEEEKGPKKKLDLLRQNWKKAPRGGGFPLLSYASFSPPPKREQSGKKKRPFFLPFFLRERAKKGCTFRPPKNSGYSAAVTVFIPAAEK